MTAYGMHLCDREDLDFAEVFKCQFFLLPKSDDLDLRGFQSHAFGDFLICLGPDLPVIHAELSGPKPVQIVILGMAVDGDGVFVTDDVLRGAATSWTTVEAAERYIEACAGRYIALLRFEDHERLYLDPSGTMAAFYDPTSRRVGSTLNLVLDRPVEPNQSYPLDPELLRRGAARYAFGHSRDQHAKVQSGNHYLDLTCFEEVRHWPREGEDFFYSDISAVDKIDLIYARLKQVMSALCQATKPSLLPLSGGADSRLLLAGVQHEPALVDHYFSHATNGQSRRDIMISRELTKVIGADLLENDFFSNPVDMFADDTKVEQYQRSYHIAAGHWDGMPALAPEQLEIRFNLPPGGILMRGHLIDVLKAVLWRRGVAEYVEGRPHAIRMGIKRMMLGDANSIRHPSIQKMYHRWFDSLPSAAQSRAYDFMGTELYRPYTIGVNFYANTNNFMICPACDREIIALSASLPPDERICFIHNDLLLSRHAPKLKAIRYVRKNDNRARVSPFYKDKMKSLSGHLSDATADVSS